MIKTNVHKKIVIHFFQWSRKAYAIFASIGKDIKICRLTVGLCEQASLKLASFIIDINLFMTECDESEEELEQLEIAMLPINVAQQTVRLKSRNKQINKIYKGYIG